MKSTSDNVIRLPLPGQLSSNTTPADFRDAERRAAYRYLECAVEVAPCPEELVYVLFLLVAAREAAGEDTGI